jgi:SAM-dependent methyltransferase
MTATVPAYLDAMFAAHASGRAGRSIHLGYWPPGQTCEPDDFAAAQARLDDFVINAAAIRDDLAVLDVACGLGGLLATLGTRFRGMELTGVNHDPRQLDACHRVRPRPDTILRWIEADACRLPFADASFDRVFCVEAMFHFRSRDAFLREAFRVLRPDGRLVVTDILLSPPADDDAARAVHADLLAAYGPWPEPWSSAGLLGSRFAAAGFADVAVADLTPATLPSYRFLLPGGSEPSAGNCGRPSEDPRGRSLAALHRLHAGGDPASGGRLIYGCASGRRPGAETAAERLVRKVAGLKAPLLQERSLRFAPAGVGSERFLLSLAKPAISGDAAARLAAAWRDLGMPAECLAAALEHLPSARHVHFGYEGGPGPARYKVYLEFPPQVAAGPGLLHVAFKWDPVGVAPPAVTRYLLHPPADRVGILALLASFHDGGAAHPSFSLFATVINRALGRCAAADLQVLEVVEDGGRRSYVVNVSNAALKVGDVRQELTALGCAVNSDAAAVAAAVAARAGDGLGHVAGGVHRDGRAFVTIYHGAGPWPPEGDASPRALSGVKEGPCV